MDDLIEKIVDDWSIGREKADDAYWEEIGSHAAFCDDTSDNAESLLGLEAIGGDSETALENAINFKNEGNKYFTKRNYILAISYYQKALSLAVDDDILNCILYANRATCQFYKENYRKCIDDCKKAIKLNKNYIKAYLRAALAADVVNKLDEAIYFCDNGLEICNDNKDLSCLMEKLIAKKKLESESKMCLVSRPLMIIENILIARGVVINEEVPMIEIPREHLSHPFTDKDNNIHFNVLILYPEYSQTDFLQDVVETATLMDCLNTIFTVNEKTVDWDLNGHYVLYNSNMKLALQSYYSNYRNDMIEIPLDTTISTFLTLEGYYMRSDLVIEVNVVSNISKKFIDKWNKDSVNLNLD